MGIVAPQLRQSVLSKSGTRSLIFVFAAGALTYAIYWLVRNVAPDPLNHLPYFGLFGAAAVLLLLFLSAAVTGDWNPLALAMGADNRLSTSKFQVLLWTATVAFVYVMAYAARAIAEHHFDPITAVPQNVLIALGISLTSAVAAQAITGSQTATNADAKTANATPSYDPAALVRNDDAQMPSLTKVQMLFWTIVAITVYLVRSFETLGNMIHCPAGTPPPLTCGFPDIDNTLMVFMGLGHATYLGAKLSGAGVPSLSGASAVADATSGTGFTLSLSGANLGTTPGTITMNGTAVTPSRLNWQPGTISLDLPNKPGGQPWAAGDMADFAVSVNGAASGTVRFKF